MNALSIIIAFGVFIVLGAVIGLLLALASKVFHVEVDERIPAITECLPGANCGGCGFPGCSGLAEAIVAGTAKTNACTVGDDEVSEKIAEIMGVKAEKAVRMRAQVMCSGTEECSKKKLTYVGVSDCHAAAALGGGDKACPNGCIGLGSCVKSCPFDAITVENGVASVDYVKCRGCGVCVASCPLHIIELIPYDSRHWVGCKSVSDGKMTRNVCDMGCIGCNICAKNCPEKAIVVENHVARIDYSKCTGCDLCISKCPRKIIWSAATYGTDGIVISRL
ncbi:MAG: RnfABCDGE type electron transport complex subunit B [Ruminococcaceae bacterium]|nr:RnfABCDGE type electron transport complex subunit B [Oscillospiraceae bacterium]